MGRQGLWAALNWIGLGYWMMSPSSCYDALSAFLPFCKKSPLFDTSFHGDGKAFYTSFFVAVVRPVLIFVVPTYLLTNEIFLS